MDSPKTLFLLLFYLITTTHSLPCTNEIESWCSTTPHPDSCRYCLSHTPAPLRLKTLSDFYTLSLKSALNLSLHATSRIHQLRNRCQSSSQKTAWLDCQHLFANTILQLNRTLSPSCTTIDQQTWLSAALTNLHTCAKGFADLKANSSFMRPVSRYNVSDVISNCLAINSRGVGAAMVDDFVVEELGGVDFVVAKDGSGNFGTVREAIEAAVEMRRRSGKRIVVHVKAGVYAEYLMVGSGLDGLTIVGDGKGKTIITGQRSVALGFTTFSCPTLSKNSYMFLLL